MSASAWEPETFKVLEILKVFLRDRVAPSIKITYRHFVLSSAPIEALELLQNNLSILFEMKEILTNAISTLSD